MAEGNSKFPSQDPSGIFSRLNHHHLMDQHRRMSVDCERPGIQVFKFIGLMNRQRMRRAHCSSMLVLSEEVRIFVQGFLSPLVRFLKKLKSKVRASEKGRGHARQGRGHARHVTGRAVPDQSCGICRAAMGKVLMCQPTQKQGKRAELKRIDSHRSTTRRRLSTCFCPMTPPGQRGPPPS